MLIFLNHFRENLAQFEMMEWRNSIQNLEGSLDSVVRPKSEEVLEEEQLASLGAIKFEYQLVGHTILGKECIGEI